MTRREFAALASAATLSLFSATGCTDRAAVAEPQMTAMAEVMLPRSIEIQRYLTRPVDFSGSGSAEGLEVVMAAQDAEQDPCKCVGTLQFELYTQRLASGDKLGTRLAHWPVEMNNAEQVRKHWDRASRFFRFPLEFEGRLPEGNYVLTATLRTPTGESLFDEYVFKYDGARVKLAN